VSKPSFVSSTAPLDTAQVLAFARALHRGGAAFPDTLTRSGLNFNKYIRRLADRTIEVWYLPALQANGLLAWGAEVRQVYDREGRTLIGSEVAGAGLQGRYGDTTHLLDIDERARDVPSVGAIFFLLAYHDRFQKVYICTSRFLTTVARADGGQLVWIHALRDTTRGR